MNKRQSQAYLKVRQFLEDESDRRAGSFPASHPYMRELSRAFSGLESLANELNRLQTPKPGKPAMRVHRDTAKDGT